MDKKTIQKARSEYLKILPSNLKACLTVDNNEKTDGYLFTADLLKFRVRGTDQFKKWNKYFDKYYSESRDILSYVNPPVGTIVDAFDGTQKKVHCNTVKSLFKDYESENNYKYNTEMIDIKGYKCIIVIS